MPQKTERLHALDALRAIMMLLGVVLHTALTYNVTDHGGAWSLKDPLTTHVATDFLVLLIHSFRMPVFFWIAGFFGALLFYERGLHRMVRNRINRILFPFLVFLLLLKPIQNFVVGYSQRSMQGGENLLAPLLARLTKLDAYLPEYTFHLWFLYYLFLFTAGSVGLALLLRRLPGLTSSITVGFRWLLGRPVTRLLVLATGTAILLGLLGTSMVDASTSLVPEGKTFVYFGSFYLAGWVLYRTKDRLPDLKNYAWAQTGLGLGLIALHGVLIQYTDLGMEPGDTSLASLVLAAATVWLFVFGITGLFLRYAAGYSPAMRYVSDASYWVYLLHLPITMLLPGLIWTWPLPALAKFTLVVVITTGICFVTYHYFVRNTGIGSFLNGRRYPGGYRALILPPAPAAAPPHHDPTTATTEESAANPTPPRSPASN
ncbi:MAG: acyltransferase family protein [Bacteroidota bacterium]